MPDQLINSHSPLLALPAEILLLVFDCFFDTQQPQIILESTERYYYNYSEAFSTLNALERTCRSLRPIAKEVLNTKCLWKFHSLLQLLQKVIVSDERPRTLRYLEMLIHFQDQGTIIHGGHERSLSKN